MSTWSLDEARFRAEVFQPLDAGWEARDDLFRVYQIPVRTENTDQIDKALDGVSRHIKRNAIGGAFVAVANTLLEVHKDATRILRDSTARAGHRKQVLAAHQKLQEALRAELPTAQDIPPAVVATMATRFGPRFVRREVEEALIALGCRIREPVELPAGKLPSDWRKVKAGLRFLRFPSLGGYLRERFKAGAGVTRDQLSRRRDELDRQASGDALTAETTILVAVQRWLAKGELRDVLRTETLQQLAAEAALGADHLGTVLQAPDMAGQLPELGLPKPDELAYALLCRQRYPAGSAQSAWLSAYQDARAARDLRTAYDVLAAQKDLTPELAAARNELKAQIAEVDQLMAQARAVEGADVETAAELYTLAGRLCPDPEADAALRRCRPAPPPRALARLDGEQVHVEWQPSSARVGDITYRVVRQLRGSSGGAGSVVAASTSDLTVTDLAAPAGVPVRYAIWTLRNDAPSVRATTTASVVVLRPVQNLELLPGDGVVELRWQLPTGATGARVTRHDEESGASTEPTMTSDHSGDGCRDTTVRTGVSYRYLVEARYQSADGLARYAPAVSGTITPQEPPQPVRDLALQVAEDSVVLSWTPPPRGEVDVRLLDTAPQARPGSALTLASAHRLGAPLRTRGAGGPQPPGTLRVAIPADGRRHWLLPLTVVGDVATVGHPVEYDSRLPMITDLRAERLGSQVRLTWRWPPPAAEVRVRAKLGEPPGGPEDTDATSWRLTFAKYEQVGCHLDLPGDDCWFSVCVAAFTDGKPVFGPPATVQLGALRQARYEITRVGRFRYRNRRRLSVTSASGPLPAVRVVARAKLPPQVPSDGVEVARFPAPGADATVLTGEFALPTRDRPLFLRAFPVNGSANRIVLVAVKPTQLRID